MNGGKSSLRVVELRCLAGIAHEIESARRQWKVEGLLGGENGGFYVSLVHELYWQSPEALGIESPIELVAVMRTR